ncbi:ead/Ea22-like family protein [Salmonella enterica]|uniref:Ead/Ea22-like family protein n=6 Tax=Salmonella enterica TaxID=28901 RepID=A0A5T2E1N8_SALER|nr:ead/Ea22-like family protein [Salmonella enterica]EAT5601901.1 ead/Ea22-like family protein [Salmonella enterica]EAX1336144.1 ead/Ea22-like family protein [Salmonella enterica]EHX6416152.1 ead/Ea22-like family protein [Salmonella enterica]EJA8413440.1 ead/Ea22-like family protein [Salmonella enterica]
MSNIKGPLISSQRYLDKAKVNDRAARFKRFIVSVYPIVLRGQQYTILMDGHHNYAAAKLAGIEPDYRPITKKVQRILGEMSWRERGKDISELEAARQRIAELEARAVNLPKRSVGEVMHLSGFSRDYAEGWCAGNDNAMHEIRAAGIKVKGE